MQLDDKQYKGFDIISIEEINEISSVAIYLRHKKTGLEVFHLLNDDTENLCSFCFRTPSENSTGVSHILEHSVLCGSEKFPIRDPFIHLENQSLKTYLNALTGQMTTMYPVSSVIEQDYFNLVSVYADSVFFPKLKKEAFMQEAYHLEKNATGEYSIQGVVYNEMKGVYSSFDSICNNAVISSILPGTIADLDFGGNPAEIPNLTYEQYLLTHKKFYRPNNCLVFLYGNISTEKQLDFLQEFLLNRLEVRLDYYSELSVTPLEILKTEKKRKLPPPISVEVFGPNVLEHDKDEKPSVFYSWRFPKLTSLKEFLEQKLISDILTQNDGSPLTKALIDCGLAKEVSSYNGFSGGFLYSYFSVGVDGFKKKNTEKLYKVVINVVEKLVKNGINQDDIDCALMQFEIEMKEIKRAYGPYSLVYMKRVLNFWIFGENPTTGLYLQSAIDSLKKEIANDKNYICKLLKKYFLYNNDFSCCVITPSPKYAKECRRLEDIQIEKLKSQISDEQLEQEIKLLRQFQQQDETKLISCLPSINARTIEYQIPQIKTEFQIIENSSKNKFPFMCNEENTNGINYFSVCFPIDVLSPEEYNYVSILQYVITEIGWKGLSWDKCATIIDKYSGAFVTGSITGECAFTERAKKMKLEYEKYNIVDREWFCFHVKMLAENTKQCLQFVSDCILEPDFSDTKRIKFLFDEMLSDFENSVSTSGQAYMASLANSEFSKAKASDEIFEGLTNLFFLKKIKGDYKLLKSKLLQISNKLFKSGGVINLICDKNSKTTSIELIKEFASRIELKIPEPTNPKTNFESLKANIKFPQAQKNLYFFEKDIQVGFSSCSFNASSYTTIEAAAESVYSHWLSNSLLWERIRTVCGAYGAYAHNDSVAQVFEISTYRDPNPYKSLQEIELCLKAATEKEFTQEEVIKAVTGNFSSVLKPMTPKTKGYIGFERILTCIHQDDVNTRIKNILKVTPKDMHAAAKRIYENFQKSCKKAILSPKSQKISSLTEKIGL